MRLLFDTEANGLLDTLTTIHSMCIKDLDSGEVWSCHDHDHPDGFTIRYGLSLLSNADELIGHNSIKFDIPAIQQVYPDWTYRGIVRDTIILARICYPDLDGMDHQLMVRGKLPRKLFGAHKLEAWGYRLGIRKGEYAEHDDPERWALWTPEMQAYCLQDVMVLEALYRKLSTSNVPQTSIDLEHDVQFVVAQMERNGFPFDEEKAVLLYAKLAQRRTELGDELKKTFGYWWTSVPAEGAREGRRWTTRDYGYHTRRGPKKTTVRGYYETTEGPWERTTLVEFNPSSRHHIASRLKHKFGWEPSEFTPSGEPKIDDSTLATIDHPEAKLLMEYFLVDKRIAAIAEGRQAWLKLVKNGKLHGSVNPLGTISGRASHSNPNMSHVPSCSAPYGPECRELFHVPKGWKLVGVDLKGLELRVLGHFMALFDKGLYARLVVEGDPHTENQTGVGLYSRNSAKTFIYGLIYGAGDPKLGFIVREDAKAAGVTLQDDDKTLGAKARSRIEAKFPALAKITQAVSLKAQGFTPLANGQKVPKGTPRQHISVLDGRTWLKTSKGGFIKSLTGRKLPVRKEHAILNLLLQNAGAELAKVWVVETDKRLKASGLKHGWDGDYALLAWSHDEQQIAARDEFEDHVGRVALGAAKYAGEFFNFRCPIEADTPKVGMSWKDTH